MPTMKFKPGESGNPNGRPKGSKSKNTLMEDALKSFGERNGIDAQQAIIDSIVNQAIEGDLQAAKMVMDRLTPAFKSVSAPVQLPKMPKDIFAKGEKILSLVASGEVSVDVAKDLLAGISSLMSIKEKIELEERISKLEEANVQS